MSVSFFFHPDEIEITSEEYWNPYDEKQRVNLVIKDKDGHMAAFFGGPSDMYDLAACIYAAVRDRKIGEGDES